MKRYLILTISIAISSCATSPNSFDRGNNAWASVVSGCKSAAELAGTANDKAVWTYEKAAVLNDRNGGWPSDRTQLNIAIKKDKQNLIAAGDSAASEQLARCHQVVETHFKEGHPAL